MKQIGCGRPPHADLHLADELHRQGIQAVRQSPRRLDAAKKMLEDMGGTFRDFFMTLGAYDLVLIYEAPDDAISARFQLLLASQGNVRTTTMKAFPEAAYREVIASLG